jgi:signal transduction histidine kinase
VSRRSKPLGLRREVLLFLPTAVLLLTVIACFNLVVYRNAVLDIESERLEEARVLASRTASELALGPAPTAERLEQLAATATAAAVADQTGRSVARMGAPIALDSAASQQGAGPLDPLQVGTKQLEAEVVSARVPFERNGRSYTIQIDLGAERLAAHRNGLSRILLLNGVILGALTVLVLLFIRRLLAPYESMLARARQLEPDEAAQDQSGSEVEFLVGTFERALDELDQRRQQPNDDIGLLEQTLAPSLESGFMLLDTEGQVLSVNQLGADLLDIGRPEKPTALADLLYLHEGFRSVIAAAVREGTSIQREECAVPGADGERILGLTVHPLRRDDREIRGFIVLYADLTAALAEQQRAQIDRGLAQLGEVAAGVAHELRNGLATMKGYLGLIEHRPEQDTIEDYLQEMRVESDHLERVLNDFLSFARPDSMRVESVDLGTVVARAAHDPGYKGATIDLRVEDTTQVEGDAQLLERAVRNLLRNAAEAQLETGCTEPIALTLSVGQETAAICIEDRGPGISADIRERLFQPFASGRADGVGLGLALAHRIARLHQGELEVADRSEGGVRATLMLPVF